MLLPSSCGAFLLILYAFLAHALILQVTDRGSDSLSAFATLSTEATAARRSPPITLPPAVLPPTCPAQDQIRWHTSISRRPPRPGRNGIANKTAAEPRHQFKSTTSLNSLARIHPVTIHIHTSHPHGHTHTFRKPDCGLAQRERHGHDRRGGFTW